jgi:hypothetical protein
MESKNQCSLPPLERAGGRSAKQHRIAIVIPAAPVTDINLAT